VTVGSTGLAPLIEARRVAIVGASAREGTLPYRTLANLRAAGFEGDLFPVNPRYEELDGLPCYPTLADIPASVDLALVLVPAARTPDVVRACAEAGVGAAVLFAAGFGELGADGRLIQEKMASTARAAGLRLLGPNCQGFLYRPNSLVATFSGAVEAGLGAPSGLAYIGQSGALGGSFLGMARERGVGLTAWFSVGNQADVTVTEIAAGLIEDDAVRAIALHLESLPAGDEWRELAARAAALGRRLLVLRSGASEAGRRAAASHTGAMVSEGAGFDLTCERYGVIVVEDVDELVMVAAQAVSAEPAGPRVGVLTSSGGAGAIAADRIEEAGLRMAALSPQTERKLAEAIPPYGSAANPVDVTAQLFAQKDDAFECACRLLVRDPEVDELMVILTNVVGRDAIHVAEAIGRVRAEGAAPIAVSWLAAHDQIAPAVTLLREAGVPVHGSIRGPIVTFGRLLREQGTAPRPEAPPAQNRELAGAVSGRQSGALGEWSGRELLARLGIPQPPQELATSTEEAAAAGRRFGRDLVLKVQASEIAHKADAGCVRVGVRPVDAPTVYRDLLANARTAAPDAVIEGVLVQQQAPPAIDLLLGVERGRDGYPPILTVGLGGTATEIHHDIASALAPVSEADAKDLLKRLRSWPLLNGYRGGVAADVATLIETITSVSDAALELGPRLVELEINPLRVYQHGVLALDLVARIASDAESQDSSG
jgi:acetate---CoA ligase (ADP-forming)